MDSSRPDSEAQAFIEELRQIFGEHRASCVLIGGAAVNFWREPRFTADLDFIVAAEPAVISEVVERLRAAGFEVAREQACDLPSGPDFLQVVKPGTNRRVEFQAAKTPFQEQVIERGVSDGRAAPFTIASPEDLIILKLIANRSKDHADLIELGQIEGLDWSYVEPWAEVWQVTGRLAELRAALAAEEQRRRDLFT